MKNKISIFLILLAVVIFIIYQIPAKKSNFFENYPHQDKASESLKEFQSRALTTIEVDGVEWSYFSGGQGQKTILFLHGMGGAYDLWWQQINALESDYKIITYSLPEDINSLEKTSKGIQAILEKEKVDKFYAVGTSMGGYITQYLVRTMPERVEKAVFGNTFPPNDFQSKKNEKISTIVPKLPEVLIGVFGEKKLNEQLLPAGKNDELLTAFLPSLPFSKKGFIGRYAVVIDKFTVNPETYAIKRIPKLIIESDNDPLVEEVLRTELKELYKDAEVFTFQGEGHFPYINAAEQYNELLSEFLKKPIEKVKIESLIKQFYFQGRRKGHIRVLKEAFSRDAKLYMQKDNRVLQISVEDYFKKVEEDGAKEVQTTILSLDVQNNIAYCKTKFEYTDKTYIDYLTLVKQKESKVGWKIVTKTFTKIK